MRSEAKLRGSPKSAQSRSSEFSPEPRTTASVPPCSLACAPPSPIETELRAQASVIGKQKTDQTADGGHQKSVRGGEAQQGNGIAPDVALSRNHVTYYQAPVGLQQPME